MSNIVYFNKNKILKKLLIIEEKGVLEDFFTGELINRGFEFYSENRVDRILSSIQSNSPDIILIDTSLTSLNAFDVVKMLKFEQNTKNIPIIIVSTLGTADNVQAGIECGASDCIISPFDRRDFLKKIEALLVSKDSCA